MNRVAVSVIGPPGVGKSTVTGHLAAQWTAPVFRLREFAAAYRRAHPEAEAWFATDDPLGWFSDGTAARLLRTAFLDIGFRSWPVLLENLPGNACQLIDTSVVLELLDVRYVVVELTVSDDVLRQRVRRRRVCPTCEPDEAGDPHRPAVGHQERADRCARCNGRLRRRPQDDRELFARRLARYVTSVDGIRGAAPRLPLVFRTLDASAGVPEMLSQVDDLLNGVLKEVPNVEVNR